MPGTTVCGSEGKRNAVSEVHYQVLLCKDICEGRKDINKL